VLCIKIQVKGKIRFKNVMSNRDDISGVTVALHLSVLPIKKIIKSSLNWRINPWLCEIRHAVGL